MPVLGYKRVWSSCERCKDSSPQGGRDRQPPIGIRIRTWGTQKVAFSSVTHEDRCSLELLFAWGSNSAELTDLVMVVRCTIVVRMSLFSKVYQWPLFPYAESTLKSLQQIFFFFACTLLHDFCDFFSLSFNHRHIITGAVLSSSIWTANYCIGRKTVEAVVLLQGSTTVLSAQFRACYFKSKQKRVVSSAQFY